MANLLDGDVDPEMLATLQRYAGTLPPPGNTLDQAGMTHEAPPAFDTTARYAGGIARWLGDMPGKALNVAMGGPTMMADISSGQLDPNSPEAIRRAADVVMQTAGLGMMGAERSALGALGGKGAAAGFPEDFDIKGFGLENFVNSLVGTKDTIPSKAAAKITLPKGPGEFSKLTPSKAPDAGAIGYAGVEKEMDDLLSHFEAKKQAALASAPHPAAPPGQVLPPLPQEAEALRSKFPIDAYHGTDVASPFDEFKLPADEIGTHFGTVQAAHDILGLPIKPINSRIYPVKLRVQNPLTMPDLGTWHDYKIGDELITQGFPREEVKPALQRGIDGLRDYLSSKGYDGIKYVNAAEHPGSISYVIWDPARVRSPWAKFDPRSMSSRNLGAGIAGAAAIPAAVGASKDRRFVHDGTGAFREIVPVDHDPFAGGQE